MRKGSDRCLFSFKHLDSITILFSKTCQARKSGSELANVVDPLYNPPQILRVEGLGYAWFFANAPSSVRGDPGRLNAFIHLIPDDCIDAVCGFAFRCSVFYYVHSELSLSLAL